MFTVTHNTDRVAIVLNKALKAKAKAFDDAIAKTANDIRADAVRNLLSGNSPERGGIDSKIKVKKYKSTSKYSSSYKVTVFDRHAPFIEFGTKAKYKNPGNGLGQVAVKWKDTPLDFQLLARRIKKTNGISLADAKKRALGILKGGSTPRPFFYPAVFENVKKMKSRFKNILKQKING